MRTIRDASPRRLLALAVVILIAVALLLARSHKSPHPAAVRPASTATGAPTRTTPRPTTVRATRTPRPRAPTATAAYAAAQKFANAYARYLEGSISVRLLDPATAAVRHRAAQAGPIPRTLRGGWTSRLKVIPDGGTANSPRDTLAMTDRNGHTYNATVTLTHARSGWLVSTLDPPSYAGVHPPPVPGGQPPAAAKAAARAYFSTYILWFYGQLPVGGIKDATPALRAKFAAFPLKMPQAQQMLHPHVGPLWLQRAQRGDPWRGWGAWATINDGQNTYYLGAAMSQIRGVWLASSMIPTT